MRNLNTSDIFRAMRVVKAAKIRNEIKLIALQMTEEKEIKVEEVGVDLFLSIIEGLSEVNSEEMMYEFLAGPLEVGKEDIAKMDVAELIQKIKELGEMQGEEGWKGFFKLLRDLIR